MKVFINPGHCPGIDPGACGHGLQEAEVALGIGKRVEQYLQAIGYQTKLFQYDGLREIAFDANAWAADIFVSIHCNAAANSAAHGTESFYWNASNDGRLLARAINEQIVTSLKITDRGVKTANFAVLAYTDMPATLVETAFITNQLDASLLRDKQDAFARAIARGVTDYVHERRPLPDVIETPIKSGKLSEHFDSSEFTCHHCGGGADKIHPRLIALLEELRGRVGKPLHINSGYRCPVHNANVGGVSNSQHVQGTAADVATPAGVSFKRFEQIVKQIPFDGIGLYPPIEGSGSFIHVDVRNGGVGRHIIWQG